jgi:hypothetical protein
MTCIFTHSEIRRKENGALPPATNEPLSIALRAIVLSERAGFVGWRFLVIICAGSLMEIE